MATDITIAIAIAIAIDSCNPNGSYLALDWNAVLGAFDHGSSLFLGLLELISSLFYSSGWNQYTDRGKFGKIVSGFERSNGYAEVDRYSFKYSVEEAKEDVEEVEDAEEMREPQTEDTQENVKEKSPHKHQYQ
ncbi:hypothetical protein EYC80_005497 [Monilinia laxa]|uniref:Uncharacterized protein n=1 Tax=Monilinia laxa TaxID=61186 RepID=A0A5N6KEF6_MONLA|nr:hypothetical protein EYC80_005497 [Monilinia laxa]